MATISVMNGKGELKLRKSTSLVGIKSTNQESISQQDFVKADVLPNLGGFQVVTLEQQGHDIDTSLDQARQQDSVAVGTHVYFAEGSNKPIVATGEIYITFETGVGTDEQQIVLDEYHLEVVERRSASLVVARVTPQSPNPFKTAAALQALSLVTTAEPDLDMPMDEYAFAAPTDNLIPNQWHLENNGFVVDANFRLKKGADAHVLSAWNRLGNMGSSQITVAVIDNGFDVNHPDLKGKIYKPWDLWAKSPNLPQGDANFTHGTPCASVAIAASNGSGIVGAAPGVRFMPIHGTSFSVSTTEEMFDYCIRNGADIISCSWGTTDPRYSLNSLKEQAIARAAREGRGGKGCVILFATGNDNLNYVNFYAAHRDVIAVSASTSQDTFANYANQGVEVSVCAPSNGDWPIIAARASWDPGLSGETGNYKYWRDGRDRGSNYKHFGGTSSSTPLVAGICALILSANPNLTAREVKSILQQTADKIGDPSEYSNTGQSLKYGYGRVNADKAVAEALRRADAVQPAPVPEVTANIASGRGLFRFDVRKQAAQGWGVQMGAFYEYGNVLIQAEKLQKQFNAPIVVSINELNGKTVYKITVGAYDTAASARDLLDRMKKAGVDGFLRNLADLA
ncbi:MAG: peptidase S8 and S53 subtilisin kexin sedolisin [Bacteroidetes bacterium]|nr:MAG: peptidase S8 and S53 subtilisin kexin sedolisin [Bacteroidota bacterium]